MSILIFKKPPIDNTKLVYSNDLKEYFKSLSQDIHEKLEAYHFDNFYEWEFKKEHNIVSNIPSIVIQYLIMAGAVPEIGNLANVRQKNREVVLIRQSKENLKNIKKRKKISAVAEDNNVSNKNNDKFLFTLNFVRAVNSWPT